MQPAQKLTKVESRIVVDGIQILSKKSCKLEFFDKTSTR
jgi:hypothetical protein